MKQIKQKTINFSIIICCYNSEKYIKDTLRSISDQVYSNYEIIIVNDGSEDNTSTLVKEFIKENNNLSVKYIYIQNNGLANARNIAVNNSKYEWIAIIDHDDIWLKNKLKIQAEEILRHHSKKLFFSDYLIFGKNINKSRFKIFKEKDNFITHDLNLKTYNGYINLILHGCFIGSSTVVFSKDIITKIGFFDKQYRFITDYVFFLKVSKKFEIHCTNQILSKWRNHSLQASNKLSNIYYHEMFKLYKRFIISNNLNYIIKLKIIKKFIRLIISYIFNKYLYEKK